MRNSKYQTALLLVATIVTPVLAYDIDDRLNPDVALLCRSTASGDIAGVQKALKMKANIEIGCNENNQTPLMFAAVNGDEAMVKKLLQAKASVNAQDAQGTFVLSYAIHSGKWNIFELLMKAGASVKPTKWKRESYGEDGSRVTTDAVYNPIVDAAGLADTRILQYVLDKGGSADAEAVYIAVDKDNEVAIRLLAAAKANLNGAYGKNWFTPVIRAARENKLKALAALIAAGAYLNKKDRVGFTAVMGAALYRRAEAVKLLIAAKADLNQKSPQGKTALTIALEAKETGIAEMLRNAGAKE